MKKSQHLLKKQKSKWALVLMGGGARGLAHIGVLDIFQKNGLMPDVIVGTSMGGVIGGLFAYGLSPLKLKELMNDVRLKKLIDKLIPRLLLKKPNILFDYRILGNFGQRMLQEIGLKRKDLVESYLKNIVGDVHIEDLPIEFACNAVDLISGREIVFDRGKLYEAIRATMSYPFILEPAKIGDMLLLDGGILDNAPVEVAKKLGAELVILVDIHKPLDEMPEKRCANTFQLVQRMIETMIENTTEEKMKRADIILKLDLNFDIFDFSDPLKIIEAGENVTTQNLEEIKRLVTGGSHNLVKKYFQSKRG